MAKTRPKQLASEKRQLNVRISDDASAILDAVLERDGVSYQAQIERALILWAAEKNIEVPHGKAKAARR